MDNIYISILIAFYNGIDFIKDAINSVIYQTYDKWQLIIGINGHDINSNIIQKVQDIVNELDPYKKYDILIKFYNTSGKSKTLNSMVLDAKHDYIAILDADDIWVNNKLELQVPYLKDYDVIGGSCEYFGDMFGTPKIPIGYFSNTHDIFSYNPIINSSVIINKKDAFWDDENYVKDIGLDDYSLWFKLYFLKRKFYNLNDILCKIRIHKTSAFNNNNNNNVPELKKLWQDYYNNHK